MLARQISGMQRGLELCPESAVVPRYNHSDVETRTQGEFEDEILWRPHAAAPTGRLLWTHANTWSQSALLCDRPCYSWLCDSHRALRERGAERSYPPHRGASRAASIIGGWTLMSSVNPVAALKQVLATRGKGVCEK